MTEGLWNDLVDKSIETLVVSIELFNRPHDIGRIESVIILLDHSFEILLKAGILKQGERIHRSDGNETIGFSKCVKISTRLDILDDDEAITLRAINSYRDAAQHYLVDIPELLLYSLMHSGFSIFRRVLDDHFNKDLQYILPNRVLPVSTMALINIHTLFDHEIIEIKKLLDNENPRKATNRLRTFAILDNVVKGDNNQPNENILSDNLENIREGMHWLELFPGIARIKIGEVDTEEYIGLKITKDEDALPVRIVDEDDPDNPPVALKRVNELGYYNLNITKMSTHLPITLPKTVALVRYLGIKDDEDYYKEVKIGSTSHELYSQKALIRCKEAIEEVDIVEVWEKCGYGRWKLE